jgi:hypothetical protein
VPPEAPSLPPPSLPSAVSPAAAGILAADAIDPELLALPDPPRRERSLTVVLLAITACASCLMSFALRGDVAYALSAPAALDLGELRDMSTGFVADNRFVRGRAVLGAVGAIRFERSLESGSCRVSPVAGRRDLWIEVRVPEGEENGRYVPPTSFAGRLVTFDDAGPRHRGLASAIEAVTGEAIPRGARLLVDGDVPSRARWVVALAAVFLAFAMWNAWAIARLLGRAR